MIKGIAVSSTPVAVNTVDVRLPTPCAHIGLSSGDPLDRASRQLLQLVSVVHAPALQRVARSPPALIRLPPAERELLLPILPSGHALAALRPHHASAELLSPVHPLRAVPASIRRPAWAHGVRWKCAVWDADID